MALQWLDIVIVAILAFAGFSGFKNGFLKEIIGTIALVVGIIGAIILADVGVRFLTEEMELTSPFVPTLSYILVFLALFLAVYATGRILNMLINVTLLGVVNRIAGIVFSGLKYALAISLILWLINVSGLLEKSVHEYSQITPYIEPMAPFVIEWVTSQTEGFKDLIPSIEQYFEQFKEDLTPKITL